MKDVAASMGIAMEVYGRLECRALGMSADAAFGLKPSGAPAAALAPAHPCRARSRPGEE
jgi:hypothetical protein